jgi:hypothetical protein
MTVFFMIIIPAVILQIAAKLGINPQQRFRDNARTATGIAFILTGVSHFVIPGKFMEMMPSFFAAPGFFF